VLDLRNNGGGLLHSSIDVVDQFLDGGVVLYEVKRGGIEKSFSAEPGGNAVDTPMVVLVNNGTASASEIVAGAIQDHDRGVLVGQTTYGKGSVQLIFDLSDGASLHLTSAQWLTPNRNQLEGVGLTPDVSIEDDEPGSVDVVLEEATDILRTGLR
jgi:carboxyl-terminal processing protease